MGKSLGTLAFLGVFQFTQAQALPSPHKQCCTRVSRIFTLYRVGGGGGREYCKKISKRMLTALSYEGLKMTKKYEYCITVPKDFLSLCS